MDRLGFFKQGLSSLLDVAQSIIGLKHAADSFTEAVDEALSNIKTDIGLYLPSLDAGMYEDPQGTIYDIAEMGYTMIEVGAFAAGKVHNLPAARIKELADNTGLKIAGAHINKFYVRPAATTESNCAAEQCNATEESSEKISSEPTSQNVPQAELPDANSKWWDKALDTVKQLGCQHVVMSQLPDYPTDEVITEYIAYLNLIGDLAAKRDLQFCFHPRKVDLATKEGEPSVFERIAVECDAEKVAFEIDTKEVSEAGIEIVELLKQQGKRIHLLHIHDYGIACESGKIDFDKIIAEGIRSGVKDIFIEVSGYSMPPKVCVERSLQNVQNLPSIRF